MRRMEDISAHMDSMERTPKKILDTLYEKAAEAQAHILLTDTIDPTTGEPDQRIHDAVTLITQKGLREPTLLKPDSFAAMSSEERERLVDIVLEARQGKPDAPTREEAAALLGGTNYLAAAMVRAGLADGYVGGNISTTADVIRPALKVIGGEQTPENKEGFVSDFFIMTRGSEQLFFVGCGFNPKPTVEQLAQMGVAAARKAQALGIEPRVAFLSFSTRGSADHEEAQRVRAAAQLAHDSAPDLAIEPAEMQFDAAYDENVGTRKAPDSPVAGHANILVFPDLNSGNLAYKLAERMGGFTATGPLVQGFRAPANDLSRGASATDIANVVAYTGFLAWEKQQQQAAEQATG